MTMPEYVSERLPHTPASAVTLTEYKAVARFEVGVTLMDCRAKLAGAVVGAETATRRPRTSKNSAENLAESGVKF